MCSTVQSPRLENAFSSACAARTCPAPDDADSNKTRGLLFTRKPVFAGAGISRSRGGGRHEFVAVDFRGDARASVGRRLNPYDLAPAANIDIAGIGYSLRQRQHELDFPAHFEWSFGDEIKSAIADVSRVRLELAALRFAR